MKHLYYSEDFVFTAQYSENIKRAIIGIERYIIIGKIKIVYQMIFRIITGYLVF